MKTLAEELSERTGESALFERIDETRLRCLACGHRCPIKDGYAGVCKVRFHRDGKLYAPRGYVGSVQCDPMEKKPFFHVRPGARAFSFGMLGCDLHCGYCQNWVSSQALRDPRSRLDFTPVRAEQLVQAAVAHGAEAVVSTYNEPLITADWAVEVFAEARKAGLLTGFVSNGNATPEALRYLRPWLDLYKVDLKSFNDRRYRELGGRLQPILESIRLIHEMDFWLEVVTLVVPGFNDSEEELTAMAEFLAGISPDIPWHLTAFHGDYKMDGQQGTPAGTVLRAANIGKHAGLRFVYAGNLGGAAGEWQNTLCPGCGTALVRRQGFRVVENRMSGGACGQCGERIPGVWEMPANR